MEGTYGYNAICVHCGKPIPSIDLLCRDCAQKRKSHTWRKPHCPACERPIQSVVPRKRFIRGRVKITAELCGFCGNSAEAYVLKPPKQDEPDVFDELYWEAFKQRIRERRAA